MAVRTERLDVRLSPEHKELIVRAARATGQAVTSFVLSSALDRARAALDRGASTVLSGRDWETFVREVESDAPPSPALLKAASRERRRRHE